MKQLPLAIKLLNTDMFTQRYFLNPEVKREAKNYTFLLEKLPSMQKGVVDYGECDPKVSMLYMHWHILFKKRSLRSILCERQNC